MKVSASATKRTSNHRPAIRRQRIEDPRHLQRECLAGGLCVNHRLGGVDWPSAGAWHDLAAQKTHGARRDLQSRQGLGGRRADGRLRSLVFRLPGDRQRILRHVAVAALERTGGCLPHRRGDSCRAGFRELAGRRPRLKATTRVRPSPLISALKCVAIQPATPIPVSAVGKRDFEFPSERLLREGVPNTSIFNLVACARYTMLHFCAHHPAMMSRVLEEHLRSAYHCRSI
jgi:hypothetical protein